MERVSRIRAIVLLLLFSLVLVLYAGRLFKLQIIETDGNNDNTTTYTTLTTVRASRGDILDRNGNVLVGNRASYDLVFNHYVIKSYGETNQALYTLIKKCDELGVSYSDHFPISTTEPFEYTISSYATSWQNHFQSFMVDRELDSDMTAPLLMEVLRTRYKIPADWTSEEARAIIGLRYEFDLRGVSNLPNYIFIEDVSEEHLSAILELNTPGLMVESSTVREYHTEYAAHILGAMGAMTEKQWLTYKDQNYSMDAYVGQSGFELAFEEYLHGIDGTRVDVVSKDGTIMQQYYARKYDEDGNIIGTASPIAGNNVETTIDIRIQETAEESLADIMEYLNDPERNVNKDGTPGDGLDAQGAAVIVMEVKTGNILACASYPTYNLSTMLEDWDEILADGRNPMFNRAYGAYYAPGSTFKMATLVAAMEHTDGSGTPLLAYGEGIEDKGSYDNPNLPGFSPDCLIWSSNPGVTHKSNAGPLDGTQALMVSCNYFFYELGYRLKWEYMDETAKGLGLGEPTGIEIEEEKIGWRSNPDSKKATYGTGVNATWNAGDRVLTAIGQAENRFTPLQLAVYACTLANQGTRMKATFLDRVVSADYRSMILENEPEIASEMFISDQTYETYMTGMLKVIRNDPEVPYYNGTAASYFGGPKDLYGEGDGVWPLKSEVTVWAKTGTAQHASGGSDHGAFICFAARNGEDPEVAVVIYGEKVAHGSTMAVVAEDILETYFEIEGASEVYSYENQVS